MFRTPRDKDRESLLIRTWYQEDQEIKSYEYFKRAILAVCTVILLVISIFMFAGCTMASDIPLNKAILAIIGEAEGEGYKGMLAVACAIRNRGTLNGVYGLNAPRVKNHRYSIDTYNLAQRAWKESATFDITNGADHWEGNSFKTPVWSKGMIKTLIIGNQTFYRSKNV